MVRLVIDLFAPRAQKKRSCFISVWTHQTHTN